MIRHVRTHPANPNKGVEELGFPRGWMDGGHNDANRQIPWNPNEWSSSFHDQLLLSSSQWMQLVRPKPGLFLADQIYQNNPWSIFELVKNILPPIYWTSCLILAIDRKPMRLNWIRGQNQVDAKYTTVRYLDCRCDGPHLDEKGGPKYYPPIRKILSFHLMYEPNHYRCMLGHFTSHLTRLKGVKMMFLAAKKK